MNYNSFSHLYNNPNGYGYVFREGIHPTADSVGAIKMDMVVCDVNGVATGGEFISGAYIRKKDKYNGERKHDLDYLLYDEVTGEPLVIPYDDLVANTNNQLFVNAADKKVAFTKEPLSGECLDKMDKYMGFNSPLTVDTGILSVAEGNVYVEEENNA